MNNDLSSYFEDPEFKDLLAKYEGMVESHTPTYFDAEELTDIAEYYASQSEEQKAEDAIDFALRLHPTNTDALVFKSRSLCIKGKLAEAYQIMNLIEDTSDREVKFLKADLLMDDPLEGIGCTSPFHNDGKLCILLRTSHAVVLGLRCNAESFGRILMYYRKGTL